ncbi:MAG: class II fructose-bisphosphate aldolase [Caldicoprobacterales bacterium]|jgi:fructose-bisphosphate aldolase class II
MLTNLNGILREAYKNKHAIGSFNAYNFETFKGIIDAGIETNTPIIVAFGAKYLENMSLISASAIVKSLAQDISIPVCLHLDHCSNMDTIFKAIKAGFGSVMYDGSALPFEKNLQNTKLVCQVAHACDVSVEAELGSLAAGEQSHEGSADDVEVFTNPDSAKEFVEETKVDALAVSIGTVHGLYKGKPNIRIDILKKINELLSLPLVLHGGSGIPEEDILNCIANGISKINVNTEISTYTIEETTKLLSQKQPHLSVLAINQMDYVKEIVKKYISFFGR